MRPTIVLLTDFGTSDPYVAQMKGAILRRSPHAQLVDLSHAVAPYQLEQAGFFLQTSHSHFPRGTVFVAVVDPGVGSSRRIICLVRDGRLFLAPDNGLLTALLDEPGQAQLFDLTPTADALASVSATFHGRDIFAPLAARLAEVDVLAAAGDAEPMGRPLSLDDAVRLPLPAPRFIDDALHLRVLHVDRFGNCILNAPNEPWRQTLADTCVQGYTLQVVAAHDAQPLQVVGTYAELTDHAPFGLLEGSQGYLELALGKASAAAALQLHPGDTLRIGLVRHI